VTIENKTRTGQPVRPGRRSRLRLCALIGSGDRIGAFVLPFVLVGVALNIAFPLVHSGPGNLPPVRVGCGGQAPELSPGQTRGFWLGQAAEGLAAAPVA
jgi:hypothetical protein